MDKILVVDNVTKAYPGRVAVSGASFEVRQGEIHGFLGPNGAGKSTTMRMIAGLTSITEGQMTLFGDLVHPDNKRLKNKIGILPENPPLYMDMEVEDYLKFVAKLHGVSNIKTNVEKVIENLSLKDVRRRLIGNLSKGFKQRVGLAQAIVYDAPFLILDEPTNGLDPEAVVEFRDFIKQLSVEKTILFSSHILSEVEQLCDHITIIHQGKVRASGDLKEIHRKFRQGMTIKVGLQLDKELPDLSSVGKYNVIHRQSYGTEEEYTLSFEDERDCRPEIARIVIEKGLNLLTLKVESPELEDIFLHMTERK